MAQFLQNGWGLLAQFCFALLLTLVSIAFISSLTPSNIPLITRIAFLMEGRLLSNEKQRYTLRLTQFWAITLTSMTFLKGYALSLTLNGQIVPIWFAAFYVFLVIIFPLEFWLRKQLFEENRHDTFFQFLKEMRQISFQDILNVRSLRSEIRSSSPNKLP